MDNVDTSAGRARLVMGLLRDADIIRKEYGHLETARDFDGGCIAVLTSPSLLAELGASKSELRWRFDVHVAPSSGEQFALFIMQANGAQVRLVMPLGEPAVQQYLLEGTQRERLSVLLLHEATRAPVFITIPGSFQPPGVAKHLLVKARSLPRSGQSLRRLGGLISPLDGVRSLVPEYVVTHAVTALVSKDLETELQVSLDSGRPRGTPLH